MCVISKICMCTVTTTGSPLILAGVSKNEISAPIKKHLIARRQMRQLTQLTLVLLAWRPDLDILMDVGVLKQSAGQLVGSRFSVAEGEAAEKGAKII
jgi:hypothetical protein